MSLVRGPEWLANLLRAEILHSFPAQGARLWDERELVERADVSRTVVREALRLLEAEQLVRVRPGRAGGVFATYPGTGHAARALSLVLNVGGATLTEIFEVRSLLEPPLARLAAERRREEDVERMRQYDQSLPAKAAEWNFFQFLIGEATHSKGASTMMALLYGLTDRAALGIEASAARRWMMAQYGREPDSPDRSIHGPLIDAIELGDGDAAERRYRRLIHAYKQFVATELGDLDRVHPALLRSSSDRLESWSPNLPREERQAVG